MYRRLLLASALLLLTPPLVVLADPKPKPPQAGGPGKPHPPGGGAHKPKPQQGVYHPGQGRPAGFKPMRGPPFKYPPGQAYKLWRAGETLPPAFRTPTYYFDDYATLGLGGPPPGQRWVRYGPDLLLVEAANGRIADIITKAFF